MRKLLTVIAGIFFALSLSAQNQYDDLLILRADGNWDKLIRKAEQYTLGSKTKNDAEPHYYMAYGLYKISFEADRAEKYKNAYKSSLTSIGKMLRLDKSGEVQEKHADFLDEVKLSLLELVHNEIDNDSYKRAQGWVMSFYKFGREYLPAIYLEAAVKNQNGDASTARTKWKLADQLFEEADINSWSEADKLVLMTGIYESAKILTIKRQEDKAREYMNKAAPYLENLEGWHEKYDEIVN